ncbi:MAG: hypothetical protein ABJN14_20235, partial [Paracoccaceae bacterium]
AQWVVARFHLQLLWPDQFSPVLMDHASLHSCLTPMSKGQDARGFEKGSEAVRNARPLKVSIV